MRRVRGRAVIVLIAVALAPVALAQTSRLNPTVKVLPKPTSIVPAECVEGTVAAPLRAPVEQAPAIPAAAAAVAPPRADLRTALRQVQTALENNDYNGFKTALAEARQTLENYPAGGEKQTAADVMQVYGDVERLWDYANSSPTGAFFTTDNKDIMTALGKYPAFPRAVADATMQAGGQTIYPSQETRMMLTDEAAKRLRALGVRTPARVVRETPPPVVPAPRPKPAPKEARIAPPKAAAPKVVHRPKKSAAVGGGAPPKPKKKKEPVKIAANSGAPAPSPARPSPAPAPAPVPAPVPTPPPTTTTAAPPKATETAPPVPPPTTTTAPTATATTATTDTTVSEKPAAPQQQQQQQKPAPQPAGMNLTFAIILIVVGIGVLIMLFRQAD